MIATPAPLDPRTRTALRRLEWQVRHRVRSSQVGGYRSIFRGRGVEFDQVVKYGFGDDIRDIDWNVTARMGEPFRKVFVEDRELTVCVVVEDVPSLQFGSGSRSKREVMLETAAFLMMLATHARERVCLAHVRPTGVSLLEPTRLRRQVLAAAAALLSSEPPDPTHAPLDSPWTQLSAHIAHGSLVLWLGDGHAEHPSRDWLEFRSERESIGIRIEDEWERALPDAVRAVAYDPVDGALVRLENSPRARERHAAWRAARRTSWQTWWPQARDRLVLDAQGEPHSALVSFLRRRARRGPGAA